MNTQTTKVKRDYAQQRVNFWSARCDAANHKNEPLHVQSNLLREWKKASAALVRAR